MTHDECFYFLTNVLKSSEATARELIEDAVKQGWTDFVSIGPMNVCLARVPGQTSARTRTMNFQVTIK
jgi:hypothetical protein